ncbi:hemerythrin domain-containing protein [Methanooceanicella nereidis]|nr:hemerythrin domain-containing protein [Methanocella sp. CWC-04]
MKTIKESQNVWGLFFSSLVQVSAPRISGRLEKGLREISATEELSREHAILTRLIIAMENVLTRLSSDMKTDLTPLNQSALIIKNIVIDHHMKFEEENIYPKFKYDKTLMEVADKLQAQHDMARETTKRMLELTKSKKIGNEKERDELIQSGIMMSDLIRVHIAWEESVLFTALQAALPKSSIEELDRKMLEDEAKFIGDEGLEKLFDDLSRIERAAGTHDISAFPFR